jgi:hypothetical protein
MCIHLDIITAYSMEQKLSAAKRKAIYHDWNRIIFMDFTMCFTPYEFTVVFHISLWNTGNLMRALFIISELSGISKYSRTEFHVFKSADNTVMLFDFYDKDFLLS